jgi:signal transduction histidine kinase/ActR/RegA family two-component response regulator
MTGLQVRRRVLVPATIAIIVMLVGFLVGALWLQQKYTAGQFEARLSGTQEFFQKSVEEDTRTLGAAITVLGRDEPMLQFWQDGDREALLKYVLPLAKDLRAKYEITHFYFQSLDFTNFLRVHNPERYGDVIKRYTLRHTAATGKPTCGIEMGALGMITLRLVQPCTLRGVPVGYLELGIDIKRLTGDMREVLGIQSLVLVDKQFLDRTAWTSRMKDIGCPTDWDFLPDSAIVDYTFPEVPGVLLTALSGRAVAPDRPAYELTLAGVPYLTAIIPLKDASGRRVGWIIVCDDISADRARLYHMLAVLSALCCILGATTLGAAWFYLGHVDRQIDRLRRQALAESQAKSAFLTNMSHEIRTPMTAILGFADILLQATVAPEAIEAAQTIKRNGECLLELINDILDLSKIEADQLAAERIPCSPLAIAAEVTSLMRVRAMTKNLSIQLECRGSVPEIIQSDPVRLRQILINLVGNAIKFTEHGSVQLAVSLLRHDRSPWQLQFDVIDSGIGISPDQLSRIFQVFVQADATTSRRFGGTGLGLTISKQLAEILGGDIVVSSVLGQGSTFTLLVETGPIDGIRMIHSLAEATAGIIQPSIAQPALVQSLSCRVLLVEDGSDNQRFISTVLRKAGAEVSMVENGQQALKLLWPPKREEKPFDLILMDMQMPVMDGYEATHTLRQMGYQGPIVALTAHAMKDDREKCLSVGCNDYLSKPLAPAVLLQMVSKYTLAAPKTDVQTAPAVSSGKR